MKSWKTTVLGVCAILIAVAGALVAVLDGDPTTTVNVESVVAAVVAGLTGIGLIAARDNDKSSEDVDAK
jgi:uncharacterized membrane protein